MSFGSADYLADKNLPFAVLDPLVATLARGQIFAAKGRIGNLLQIEEGDQGALVEPRSQSTLGGSAYFEGIVRFDVVFSDAFLSSIGLGPVLRGSIPEVISTRKMGGRDVFR
ncbi:hypothetical protein [Enhygromyxa salina]|uniref:Uncharacterized protein n=1 Tax=Enhygromyxa salina TaxID=215803 RepID=A0A2S9XU91_9BACT|nr:hypothetical protein [Enhygromyxa salina]PRP96404.1 hypothetical protein ENSA7_72190 [Enhygromyxa salina]